MILPLLLATTPLACPPVVVDGDTLKLCGTRVRIMAIQAPDKTNAAPCRQHNPRYVCNDRLSEASKANLRRLIEGKRVTLEYHGFDRYRRPIAIVYSNGANVACQQIRGGFATYWAEYDKGRRIAKACGR